MARPQSPRHRSGRVYRLTLVERFTREGARVRAFVRYNSRDDRGWLDDVAAESIADVDVYAGDLQNPEAVAKAVAGCDAVLHLGAIIPIPYSYRHPREYVFANIDGTINVLEASRREGVSRIVQVRPPRCTGLRRWCRSPRRIPSTHSRHTPPQRLRWTARALRLALVRDTRRRRSDACQTHVQADRSTATPRLQALCITSAHVRKRLHARRFVHAGTR